MDAQGLIMGASFPVSHPPMGRASVNSLDEELVTELHANPCIAALVAADKLVPTNSYAFSESSIEDLADTSPTNCDVSISLKGEAYHLQIQSLRSWKIGLAWRVALLYRQSDFDGGFQSAQLTTALLSVGVTVLSVLFAVCVTSCIRRPMYDILRIMNDAEHAVALPKGERQREALAAVCARWAHTSEMPLPDSQKLRQQFDAAQPQPQHDDYGSTAGGAASHLHDDPTQSLPSGSQSTSNTSRSSSLGEALRRDSVGPGMCHPLRVWWSRLLARFGRSLSEVRLMHRSFGSMLYTLAQHDQLESINAAKREFIRYIFHEVRVPFNAIVLSIEQLQHEMAEREHQVKAEQQYEASCVEAALLPLPPAPAPFATNGAQVSYSSQQAQAQHMALSAARAAVLTAASSAAAHNNSMRDVLSILSEQAGIVSRILNDVLSMQRIEEGKLELENEPFDLEKMLRLTLRSFAAPLADKELRVKFEVLLPPAPLSGGLGSGFGLGNNALMGIPIIHSARPANGDANAAAATSGGAIDSAHLTQTSTPATQLARLTPDYLLRQLKPMPVTTHQHTAAAPCATTTDSGSNGSAGAAPEEKDSNDNVSVRTPLLQSRGIDNLQHEERTREQQVQRPDSHSPQGQQQQQEQQQQQQQEEEQQQQQQRQHRARPLQRAPSSDRVQTATRVYVLGDMYRLRQVCANLISNSIKFSHVGGTIIVRLELMRFEPRSAAQRKASSLSQSDKSGADEHDKAEPVILGNVQCRFSVRDFGVGIPLEAQAGVFHAYKQHAAGRVQEGGKYDDTSWGTRHAERVSREEGRHMLVRSLLTCFVLCVCICMVCSLF